MNFNDSQEEIRPGSGRNFLNSPVSVGEWMTTMMMMALPIVNIVMLFIWAFSGNTNTSKANWAKATLIWGGIVVAIYILLIIVFGSFFANYMSSYY